MPSLWALGLTLSLAPLLHAQDTAGEPPVDNDNSPYHVALLDYKAGKYPEALDAINKADASSDPRIAILKSRILGDLKRFDEGAKTLAPFLNSNPPIEVQLAMGDLLLQKRDFNGATKYYNAALTTKPGDSDIMLMLVYSRIGAGDLPSASKIASQLKPLDQEHPSYYFAKAALEQATDKSEQADEDIETARTMYGIIVANHYLKTYYQVLSGPGKNAQLTPASTNAPSAMAPSKP
jgi:tetratricopeptide (TPR) repeat protein